MVVYWVVMADIVADLMCPLSMGSPVFMPYSLSSFKTCIVAVLLVLGNSEYYSFYVSVGLCSTPSSFLSDL